MKKKNSISEVSSLECLWETCKQGWPVSSWLYVLGRQIQVGNVDLGVISTEVVTEVRVTDRAQGV